MLTKLENIDITKNEIRYRLISPSKFDIVGRRRISPGVSIVVGCPKGNLTSKRKCKIGTRAQSLCFDREIFTPKKAARWIDTHRNSINDKKK